MPCPTPNQVTHTLRFLVCATIANTRGQSTLCKARDSCFAGCRNSIRASQNTPGFQSELRRLPSATCQCVIVCFSFLYRYLYILGKQPLMLCFRPVCFAFFILTGLLCAPLQAATSRIGLNVPRIARRFEPCSLEPTEHTQRPERVPPLGSPAGRRRLDRASPAADGRVRIEQPIDSVHGPQPRRGLFLQ